MQKKKIRIVWRPIKAIIETETSKGKQRYLTLKKLCSVEERDFTKNPDHITLISVPHTARAIVNVNEPEIVTVFWDREVLRLNVFRARELMSFMAKISWYLGVYGKISQNGKRTRRKLSIRLLYNMRREAKKRYGEPKHAPRMPNM